MLEVPTLELEERIRQEIEENPALEEGAEESEMLMNLPTPTMMMEAITTISIRKSIWPTMIFPIISSKQTILLSTTNVRIFRFQSE
jgi:DNA-directed RNA polymerase specialized sigma54-like protein